MKKRKEKKRNEKKRKEKKEKKRKEKKEKGEKRKNRSSLEESKNLFPRSKFLCLKDFAFIFVALGIILKIGKWEETDNRDG